MFRRALAELRPLSRNARLYYVAGALSASGGGAFGAVYNLYIVSLGYDASFLGVLLAAATLGAGLGALPAGALVDRFGPRDVLLTSSVVTALAIGLQLVLTDQWVLAGSSVAAGAGGAAFVIASAPFLQSAAAGVAPERLFSIDTAVTLTGSAIGAGTGGQLAAVLLSNAATSQPLRAFWVTLVIAGALGATSFIPLLLTRHLADRRLDDGRNRGSSAAFRPDEPEPVHAKTSAAPLAASRPNATAVAPDASTFDTSGDSNPHIPLAGPRRHPILASLARVVADPLIWRFTLVAALIGLGAGLFIPYINVYFVEVLGASPAVFGWLTAAGTAFRLLATLLAPAFSARLGAARTVGLTQLASVPLLLLLGFSPQLWPAAAAFLLRGAAMNMAAPLQTAVVMAALPERLRGTGNSAIWLASSAARGASTLLGGILIASAGYRLPYLATAVLYVAASVLWLAWFARPQRLRASQT